MLMPHRHPDIKGYEMEWTEMAVPDILRGQSGMEDVRAYVNSGGCGVLISVDHGKLHLSISREDRYPDWDEIKSARYDLMPDNMTVAMLLPPKEEYVNVHKNCFHLHELDKVTGGIILP